MTNAFPLPTNLASALADAQRDGDSRLPAWIGRLPELVAVLSDRWNLAVSRPFQPGGQGSWVAPARTSNDQDVVLKVGWRHFEAEHEAGGLRVWAGRGTVLLHDAVTFDDTSALLLERCLPGRPLTTLPATEQDEVIAALLQRLWIEPSAGHPFRPLAEMCAQWADGFELKSGPGPGLQPISSQPDRRDQPHRDQPDRRRPQPDRRIS